MSVFYSNVNKIFLGTDGAASSRVGQILPLRVEGSIPYSAPLIKLDGEILNDTEVPLRIRCISHQVTVVLEY